jgi:hypothetical protein
MSDYVWACPLLNWGNGDDSGCDPIATGTAVWIHKCGISPQTRHGPFCRIEYEVGGVRKIQHIKDVGTVTPLDEDDPTVWEILERMRNSRAPAESQQAARSKAKKVSQLADLPRRPRSRWLQG